MALKAQRREMGKGGKLQSPLLDPDNFPARLVQVIDLGLQKNFFDEDKVNHEIMLTYELVDCFCLDEDGNEVLDKPRWFSEKINLIDLPVGMDLQEIYNDQYRGKAKMVQRARAFDPKGVHDFDFSMYLGGACAVTIVQKKKKDGNLKNEVGGVSAPMRGMQIAELVNAPKMFALDEPDMEIFKSLPEWLQDTIKSNLEFKGSKLEALLSGKDVPQDKPEPQQAPEADGEMDDDIPW